MFSSPLRVIRFLKEYATSIFMVEEYAKQETIMKGVSSSSVCMKQATRLHFNPKDGGEMLLRNVDLFSVDCTALCSRR
jgi:hypothetical protein